MSRRHLVARDALAMIVVVLAAGLLLLPGLFRPLSLLYPSWTEFSDLTLILALIDPAGRMGAMTTLAVP